jgi:hypothetical protein
LDLLFCRDQRIDGCIFYDGCGHGNLGVGHEGGLIFGYIGAEAAMVFGKGIPYEAIFGCIDTGEMAEVGV